MRFPMPFFGKEEAREEVCRLALSEGSNRRQLCRRFGIGAKTLYRWLNRYRQEGSAGLVERSRCPHRTPRRTDAAMDAAVLAVRRENPVWGGRKIAASLRRQGLSPPVASTITEILRRHGRLQPPVRQRHAWQRFERAAPNHLWQMDFKGHLPLGQGAGRLHPLIVLDDHSRFAIGLQACPDERGSTVRTHLTELFRCYGLPDRMLMDNGPPWGTSQFAQHVYTPLSMWLLRLGIGISHGRPHHPQTQGKDERFHRTLKGEVIERRGWQDLADCARAFEAWRHVYNAERPHEALDLATPASRYRPSYRSFPETLAPIDYGPGAIVRKVQAKGEISFARHEWPVGKAFTGQPVALHPTSVDGRYDVIFCHQKVAELDLREAKP